ncbi:DHHC zinc finger domain containing protein [Tritrichomonas foetus]|uniref:Palmitoyltransferase n=1 Tax=Tritrichomonas foetus TaxID=1144522 RepID=A0A1J4JSQ9_9EUKA|nr:DHHC zinc finger domain containing protein [Tritrichomonas foetus]|eukprot:OHT00540.1 DHHC zinc finger domain containing protein [Tritrichomonas foetus]
MGKKIPNPNFHRKNGLTWPWDPLQVMTWFITASPCVSFFAIQFPLLPRNDIYLWIGIFLVCYVCGVILFVFATLSEHSIPPITSPDHSFFCRYCKTDVPLYAKHCRMCNRCRFGFDHHCRFINNCVTESNYFVFFFGCLFLISTAIVGLSQLIVSGIEFHNHSADVLLRMTNYYHRNVSKLTFWILFCVAVVIDLIVLCPMMVLTVYHIYFQKLNISTYDYIIKNFSKSPQKLQSFCCSSSRDHKVSSL